MAMIDKSKLPPKTYNIQAQVDEETYKHLESVAAKAGYASIGTFLVSKVCGEPEWLSVARSIVFSRMPCMAPNSIFFMTDLMTIEERLRISPVAVGRAVRMFVLNTPGVCVVEVEPKAGRNTQYQRDSSPATDLVF